MCKKLWNSPVAKPFVQEYLVLSEGTLERYTHSGWIARLEDNEFPITLGNKQTLVPGYLTKEDIQILRNYVPLEWKYECGRELGSPQRIKSAGKLSLEVKIIPEVDRHKILEFLADLEFKNIRFMNALNKD